MTTHLQLAMAMGADHRNQYLFSDHYLNELLPQDPRWEQALPEAEEFWTWIQDLYAREQGQLADYNESQLEEHWFEPILEKLGHVFERQAGVPGLDAGVKHPDYVFFPDQATRQAAVSAQSTEGYTAEALAVGEVKRWDTPLGKKRRGGGPRFEDQNPSWQVDYYVRATDLDWGVLSNGRLWRLVHRDTSQRLSIYYEVDLVDLLGRGDAGAMRYFTLFFCQAAFRADARGRIFLDDALAASNAYAVELEEDLEENVYHALERLMQGFLDLPQNGLGADDLRAIYDNSLYLLYRLLFILYGESRGLLPMDNEQYREQYSLEAIKADIIGERAPTASLTTIIWGRLKTLFHIINGDDAELNRLLRVPRYNGGLFDPQQHPFLEKKQVGDQALGEAIDLLSRRTTGAGREFADYRSLGVRHLGSIYEGLLEYQPRIAREPMVVVGGEWCPEERPLGSQKTLKVSNVVDRRDAGQVYLETDRGERKATGSYYTPQYIVEYIVEHTLGPLVDEARERVKARAKEARGKAEQSLRQSSGQALVDEVLSLKCLDPAMGSGHFLVEATEFLALALATDPYVETEAPAEEDLIHWRRRVVERCIYGVDKNPLAVELAKLSLWLATVAAGRPLSFLDHHLKCGDSLIGAWVEDLGEIPSVMLGRKALKEREARYEAGVRQANLFEMRLTEKLPVVMGRILEITEVESKDYDAVRAKEGADQAVRQLKAPFEAVANLWTSAYFGNEFINGEYDEALMQIGQPETLMALDAVQRAQKIAGERRFFHWELAFPEVFYDERGQRLGERAGFDAVVGNPPYLNVDLVWGKQSTQAEYLKSRYAVVWMGKSDVYYYFFKMALDLTNSLGFVSFITSRYYLEAHYADGLRNCLLDASRVREIIDFRNFTVFEGVGTKVCITTLQKDCADGKQETVQVKFFQLGPDLEAVDVKRLLGSEEKQMLHFSQIQQSQIPRNVWNLANWKNSHLISRIDEQCVLLGDMCFIGQGMQTGANHVFVVDRATIRNYQIGEHFVRKLVKNQDIMPYSIDFRDLYLLYPEDLVELSRHTGLGQYMKEHQDALESRAAYKRGDCKWFKFTWPLHKEKYDQPKLVVPFIAAENRFALDEHSEYIGLTDTYAIFSESSTKVSLKYLLALLNSRLLNFRYRFIAKPKDYRYEYFENGLRKIPVRRIDFTTPSDEREALVAEGKARAEVAIETLAASGVVGLDTPMDQAVLAQAASPALAFVEGRLDQEPEQADVIHDLLAYLAERMIEMHQEKQERVEGFWLDLEGVVDAETFEVLHDNGTWESSLWKAEACRSFVDGESRSTRHLDESLGWNEGCFKAFVKMLARKVSNLSEVVGVYRKHHPAYQELVERIEATDRLIDLVVYRLYGLTEEEVAIVEGR